MIYAFEAERNKLSLSRVKAQLTVSKQRLRLMLRVEQVPSRHPNQ